jgi:Mitochondrial 28S ribosomal protein S34
MLLVGRQMLARRCLSGSGVACKALSAVELSAEDEANLKPIRYRKKNLIDLCLLFLDLGQGRRFRKVTWTDPDCYWTVTKVRVTKVCARCNRGRLWGRLTWKGVEYPERKISAINKRLWTFVADADFELGPLEKMRVASPPEAASARERLQEADQHSAE